MTRVFLYEDSIPKSNVPVNSELFGMNRSDIQLTINPKFY